jgi:hypothetical protein
MKKRRRRRSFQWCCECECGVSNVPNAFDESLELEKKKKEVYCKGQHCKAFWEETDRVVKGLCFEVSAV